MNTKQTDLFSSILEIDIKEDTIIPEDDRQWCLKIQENLNKTLNGLNEWYDKFKEVIDTLGHDYQINWYDDGQCYGYMRHNIDDTDIEHYHKFEPFDAISQVAKNYNSACDAFQKRIISYFNAKYNIAVDTYGDDKEFTVRNQKRPSWEDVVQKVIAHLGGRTFSDTAKDELKADFLKKVKKYRGGHNVSIKSKVIIIQNAIWISERCCGGQPYISYDTIKTLNKLIQYLILCSDGEIVDSANSLSGLNPDYPDFARWYDVAAYNIESLKIYKNQRVDFKFKSASAAQECYNRLGLEEIEV